MLFTFPVSMYFPVGGTVTVIADFSFIGWCLGVIFGCFVISGVSGLFPVFSCVLGCKWLIINAIHFSG